MSCQPLRPSLLKQLHFPVSSQSQSKLVQKYMGKKMSAKLQATTDCCINDIGNGFAGIVS